MERDLLRDAESVRWELMLAIKLAIKEPALALAAIKGILTTWQIVTKETTAPGEFIVSQWIPTP